MRALSANTAQLADIPDLTLSRKKGVSLTSLVSPLASMQAYSITTQSQTLHLQ